MDGGVVIVVVVGVDNLFGDVGEELVGFGLRTNDAFASFVHLPPIL